MVFLRYPVFLFGVFFPRLSVARHKESFGCIVDFCGGGSILHDPFWQTDAGNTGGDHRGDRLGNAILADSIDLERFFDSYLGGFFDGFFVDVAKGGVVDFFPVRFCVESRRN